MKPKEEVKPIHYGKVLLSAIKKKGLKKQNIAVKLGMSRPTLNSRIVDGSFTESEITKILEIATE